MDSGYSKHMTGRIKDFVSLKSLHGVSISFGNRKKHNIEGVNKIGKSPNYAIENLYFVNGLKYSLFYVSQICDKGNKVNFLSKKFLSDDCTMTNLNSGEVILSVRNAKTCMLLT